MKPVDRPKAPDLRINHKDNFELCFLRHQYIRRCTHNPSREEMQPYNKIVENCSKNTFYVYKNLFLMVGLDYEDVLSSSQVHLVSFLGLFALERNPQKLDDFIRKFRGHNSIKCTDEDLLDKNKANFTCFLKQRLEDMIRICHQKAKNIKGIVAEEFIVFTGSKQPPLDIEDLIENHHSYGYKPLGTSTFKTIRKRFKSKQDGPVYLDGNTWYVCVPIKKKALSLTDFTCNNYDPYANLHNMDPEQALQTKQQDITLFGKLSNQEQARVIELFLKENKNNSKFKEEIETAHEYLESLNVSDL